MFGNIKVVTEGLKPTIGDYLGTPQLYGFQSQVFSTEVN